MKKLLLSVPLLFTITANADNFIQSDIPTQVTSIKAVLELPDDSVVTVEGYITKKLAHEIYAFKDESGKVVMEIDDEDFRGLKVTSGDKLRVSVEVDHDTNSSSLEAEYIELAG